MSSDPPMDNADPVGWMNEQLKTALRDIAKDDWPARFSLLKRPSDTHIRMVAEGALQRIEELEIEIDDTKAEMPELCSRCDGGKYIHAGLCWECRKKLSDFSEQRAESAKDSG